MRDISLTCPHCESQISFELSGEAAQREDSHFLGFVFQCPHCSAPISYQADGGEAVELDKTAFENIQKAVGKNVAIRRPTRKPQCLDPASPLGRRTTPSQRNLDAAFDNMLRDIKETDNYDEFLKRIG